MNATNNKKKVSQYINRRALSNEFYQLSSVMFVGNSLVFPKVVSLLI